jgi:hypothetical protein
MAEKELTIPAAPALLPPGLQKKWAEDYARAYAEAQGDQSMDESGRKQAALREANRILRVAAPASYAEAKRLADWQVIRRFEEGGVLKGVTIDGKKFRFDAPPVEEKAEGGKQKSEGGKQK